MTVSLSDILSAAECVFEFTAACTCELLCVCAASTVSCLRSGGNDDSVVARDGVEPCARRGYWPFNTYRPIRQDAGSRPSLGTTLQGAEGWRGYRGKSTQKGQIKESKGGVGTESAGRMNETSSSRENV